MIRTSVVSGLAHNTRFKSRRSSGRSKNRFHFLQRMALSFGVREPNGENDDQEDGSKDDVVLPSNRIQSDWVNEGIEEYSTVGTDRG